jgi:hypothetical protein
MAVIDTLKLAKRLEAAGMPQRQAEEVSAALGEALGEGLVTREYFDVCRTADREYVDLRLNEMETRLQRRIDQVVVRLGSLIVVVVGLAAALTHLFH